MIDCRGDHTWATTCRFLSGSPLWHCKLLAVELQVENTEDKDIRVIPDKKCPCKIMYEVWEQKANELENKTEKPVGWHRSSFYC